MGGMKQGVHPRVVGSLTEKWQLKMQSRSYRAYDINDCQKVELSNQIVDNISEKILDSNI